MAREYGQYDSIRAKGNIQIDENLAVTGTTVLTGATTITGALTLSGATRVDDTTASTSGTTGSLQTDGGLGVAGAAFITGNVSAAKGLCTANIGAVNTGVTAVEYGDGYNHITVLTVSQVDALTTADTAAIADGYLLYTLPAGAIVVDYTYMSMGITTTAEQQGDTPDVGIGTTIGTGSVATLDGTAGFEDLITGQLGIGDGTAEVITLIPTAGAPHVIAVGDAHTVHYNVADTWANDTSADLTADIAGTVVLVWRFLA